jgi:hypothetical protein
VFGTYFSWFPFPYEHFPFAYIRETPVFCLYSSSPMDSTWEILHKLQGGYGDRYCNPYFIKVKKGKAKLDDIDPDLIGKANLGILCQWAECLGLVFTLVVVSILVNNAVAHEKCWKVPDDWKQDRVRATSQKWSDHIEKLATWQLLSPIPEGKAICICTYFAVPKDATIWRTVFNGKYMSSMCHSPPSVNLLGIPDLLVMVGSMDRVHMRFVDIRHWFHQIPVCEFLKQRFCIMLEDPKTRKKTFYYWNALPMGWSWSPYICQCLAWSAILHNPKKEGNEYEFRLAPRQESPPKYVQIHRKGAERACGFVTLLYDNVGVFCQDHDISNQLHAQIQRNMNEANIILKPSSIIKADPGMIDIDLPERPKDNTSREKRGREAEEEEKKEKQETQNVPTRYFLEDAIYRGIQFGCRISEGLERILVRCDPKKVGTWRKRTRPDSTQPVLLSAVGGWIGVIMWSCTVRQRALCNLSEVIDVLRKVTKLGHQCQWNDSATMTLSEEEATLLTLEFEIACKNDWHPAPRATTDHNDPIVLATDASDEGWGIVEITHEDHIPYQRQGWYKQLSGSSKSKLSEFIIYLKELYCMIQALRWAMNNHPGRYVVLVGDNTAACSAMRKRYSSNRIAVAWLKKLDQDISKMSEPVEYDVISVRTDEMVADVLTRRKKLKVVSNEDELYKKCRQAVAAERVGQRLHTTEPGKRPPFKAGLRHEDDEKDALLRDEECWNQLIESTSVLGWSEPLPGSEDFRVLTNLERELV